MNIVSCQVAFVKRKFDNIQSIKTKHPDADFMEFAGMAADIENTMQEIVEEGVNIRGITHR
ncbi:hypothetical protein [Microcystis aeruginosa]|uniref:Uncharacterized protein n=1 Tax=Microcystis aeruginosa PCC 9701 TaxID=721123 RepID=I4IKT9_MICAE|nr:hypothetical protein [Microcystis aeruginosa]CCI34913.1 hypothetical protein MICAK_1150003 [Microcystis aeruginosa PCC 9701]